MNNEKIDFKALTETELNKIYEPIHSYPWENREAYVDFISNMYYFLSQACRLLTAAASECSQEYDVFHHRFVDHAKEEKNHEKLVLNDLRKLKEPLRPVMASMPPIWQTQFYMIQKKSPLSLLGCVLYLENLSLSEGIGPKIYDRCLEAYGKQATSYLRVHVEEDADHVDSLYEVLDQIPAHEAENIKESLLITSSLYKNFINELAFKNRAVSTAA